MKLKQAKKSMIKQMRDRVIHNQWPQDINIKCIKWAV